MPNGRKDDDGKTRLDLVPVGALRAVARVLGFGADRYGIDNWQEVRDWRRRYYAATLRHMTAWWDGEKLDADSGEPHLAHAACSLLFLLVLDADPRRKRQ